ncbi:helix-turn-helix transcriptional regulator [Nonomuraea sp. NPDC055795]
MILKVYRAATGLSQAALAEQLGYDRTYLTMIENGRRTITNVADLRRLAQHLGVPPYVVGVTDDAHEDTRAMIMFGESTVRLASTARQAGRAAEAINELWPLIWRMESRLTTGRADYDVARLLGSARAALGVALGDVLPEERLSAAARWTGRALHVANRIDDPDLLLLALRVHGNELRKIGRKSASITRLQHAAQIASAGNRGAVLIPLARTLGEIGDAHGFDAVLTDLHRHLDTHQLTPLVNPFVVREVTLRGLSTTGRLTAAVRLAQTNPPDLTTVAPQWRAIERVTVAEVWRKAGDTEAAELALRESISTAEALQLPHQVQRAMRATGSDMPGIREAGSEALKRLRMSGPAA